MSEIEVRPDTDTPAMRENLSELAQWALDARQAHAVAQSLANTAFVPQSMRGKPGEITAAILTGQEIGLQPMSALRSIDVIQGTPAMRAIALRGLVQSRGHEVWVEEATKTRAVVCGRRQGSEQVQKSEWSMDRARDLGLLGKDNYKKQPQAMLVARATAEVCRLIAADVLLGMPYAIEELDDPEETFAPAPPKPAPRRTARRRPLAPAPDPDDSSEEPPLEEPKDDDRSDEFRETWQEDSSPPLDAS